MPATAMGGRPDMGTTEIGAMVAVTSALVAAMTTAATTWIQSRTQRRRESGTVQTSDAQTVFQAYGQLSQMLLQLTRELSDQMRTIANQLEQVTRQQAELVRQQRDLIDLQHQQMELLAQIEGSVNGK